MFKTRRTNDETGARSWNLFGYLNIRHSEIDSNFEFRHSNLQRVLLRGDRYTDISSFTSANDVFSLRLSGPLGTEPIA
jgi:hypothetical protein